MANYLSNLINRINQQAVVVKPRPVSIFEPSGYQSIPSMFTAEPVSSNAVEPREDVKTQHRRNTQVSPQPTRDASDPDTQPPAKTPTEESWSSEPKKESVEKGYLAHRSASGLEIESLKRYPVNSTPLTRSTTQKVDVKNKTRGAPQISQARPDQKNSPAQSEEVRSSQPQKSGPAAARNTRQIMPSVKRKSFWKEDLSEKSPEINVTIGRVDVRAVSPTISEKPKKTNISAPILSLEEYLDKRDQEDTS